MYNRALSDGEGRSPRVRRNRRRRRLGDRRRGSISARAEEPRSHILRFDRAWVDLRACGGTAVGAAAETITLGRSPRVRRNLGHDLRLANRVGSISARAEEPPSATAPAARCRVDLRACGGTRPWCTCDRPRAGRSPRVRRNPQRNEDAPAVEGSISARAEEPRSTSGSPSRRRVDLRACGGTPATLSTVPIASGRSPRVRRNQRGAHGPEHIVGSISARAEEPYSGVGCASGSRVNLRACGGTLRFSSAYQRGEGRSPRVRRNHRH